MSAIDPNEPAFPNAQRLFDNDTQSWIVHSVGGMPIRLWLAGMALNGVMEFNRMQLEVDYKDVVIEKSELGTDGLEDCIAEECLRIADAMIAAYNRKESA